MELSEYDEKVLRRGINLMRLGGFLFLGIGLLFFVLGSVFLAFTQRKAQVYVETQGVIVDFDRDGHPYVAYEAQGQTYEQRSNYASSTMRLGDELTVRYDPQAPYRMEAGGAVALFLPLLFMGMGGLFIVIGVVWPSVDIASAVDLAALALACVVASFIFSRYCREYRSFF